MSELDIERLKRLHEDWQLADWDAMAMSEQEVLNRLQAIIAALEDRERLRAAIEDVVTDRICLSEMAYKRLQAALGGRDG